MRLAVPEPVIVPAAPPSSLSQVNSPLAFTVSTPPLSKGEQLNPVRMILSALLSVKSLPTPVVESTKAPAFVTNGVVTLVEKLTALLVVMLLQDPPAPRVTVLPPPERLPVPDAQVTAVLPWTAVLALEP